jgi:hypothetical protein
MSHTVIHSDQSLISISHFADDEWDVLESASHSSSAPQTAVSSSSLSSSSPSSAASVLEPDIALAIQRSIADGRHMSAAAVSSASSAPGAAAASAALAASANASKLAGSASSKSFGSENSASSSSGSESGSQKLAQLQAVLDSSVPSKKCACGSGKTFKACCMGKISTAIQNLRSSAAVYATLSSPDDQVSPSRFYLIYLSCFPSLLLCVPSPTSSSAIYACHQSQRSRVCPIVRFRCSSGQRAGQVRGFIASPHDSSRLCLILLITFLSCSGAIARSHESHVPTPLTRASAGSRTSSGASSSGKKRRRPRPRAERRRARSRRATAASTAATHRRPQPRAQRICASLAFELARADEVKIR